MFEYPLLKYAVTFESTANYLVLFYRRKKYEFNCETPTEAASALLLADGRTEVGVICRESGLDRIIIRRLFDELAKVPVILDGKAVLRDDGYLSGREMFWRLERLLFKWRYDTADPIYETNLDRMIASGQALPSVVKGFLLELGYLLRQVPDELSLAVANSPNEAIRSLYMDFYDEESRHGQIMFDALINWFSSPEFIVNAVPLPATSGLLNTYRAWASHDPLLYATALMRDESSRLDEVIGQDEDIYRGMRLHYDVPAIVVDKFEWHANLDRESDHGFFPELIFAEYDVISQSRARQLVSALKQIIELHKLFKWNVLRFYSENSCSDRINLFEEFTDAKLKFV